MQADPDADGGRLRLYAEWFELRNATDEPSRQRARVLSRQMLALQPKIPEPGEPGYEEYLFEYDQVDD